MKPESFQNIFCLEAVSYQDARFLLTPALLPEERGKQLDGILKLLGHQAEFSRCFAKRLGSFLPLHWGGSPGEGKTTNQN
jgi:hypothetical protein